jgi:hypothetical protein
MLPYAMIRKGEKRYHSVLTAVKPPSGYNRGGGKSKGYGPGRFELFQPIVALSSICYIAVTKP